MATVADFPIGSIVTIGYGNVEYVVIAHGPGGRQVQIKPTTAEVMTTPGGWYYPSQLRLVWRPESRLVWRPDGG